MRIDRLYLKDFKNLRNFEADFQVSSSRQVVVGRNGVGKSNLLEAISWIFRDLDLEAASTFAYTIEYHCNGYYVRITATESGVKDGQQARFSRTYEILKEPAQPTESNTPRAYQAIKQLDFYKKNRPVDNKLNPERLLPSYVFGYYSGTSGRFVEAYAKHEENYFNAQRKGTEAPLRPLFLAKPHHSQLALLSFFVETQSQSITARESQDKAYAFLQNEFGIISFESVLFALHKPYWTTPKRVAEKGDERFWGVEGKVESFLDGLYEHSLAPMLGERRQEVSVGRETKMEMRYFFIPNEEALRKLGEGLEPKEFFARLESAIFSDVLSSDGNDLRARINVNKASKVDKAESVSITFKELSEGEQQLMTLVGLMRFTQQNESLFLLDEPDTHLNPSWCLNYLSNLEKYGIEPPNSQMIMTTHSPLTFAGLKKKEVLILKRNEYGHIYSEHPITSPRGMGFQAILTSEFFGLRSGLDKETLKAVDRRRELAFKEDKTEAEQVELIKLDRDLSKLDFSKATRDPLYLEFVRAMTKAQGKSREIANPTPAMEEWKLRQEVAKDIAHIIKSNRKK